MLFPLGNPVVGETETAAPGLIQGRVWIGLTVFH